MNTHFHAWTKLLSLTLVQLSVFLFTSCSIAAMDPPIAKQGILDLRQWKFNKEGPVKLDGDWTFYWEQLIHHQKPNGTIHTDSTHYIAVPSDWLAYKYNGEKVSSQGYATYSLLVLLPEVAAHSKLSISIPTVATAVAIYANDSLIYEAGKVGVDADNVQAGYAPDIVNIPFYKDSLRLDMEVSNFHYRRGGAWSSFFLGNTSDIRHIWTNETGLDFFLAGCIIIMALYYLGFYFFRKEDFSYILFSISCIVLLLRLICTGQYIIRYFVALDWIWIIRLEILGFFLFIPFFVCYLNHIFPKVISKKLSLMVWIVGGSVSLLVVLSSPLVFSYAIIPYEFFTAAIGSFILIKLCLTYNKNLPGQKILLLGLLILFLAFINDALYANNIIPTGYLASFGLIIFILSQSLIMSQRVSLAIHGLENANQSLSVKNETINHKNEELIRLNKELDVFVYRTSHDLRAPLTSTLGLIEVLRMEEDPKRFGKYLDLQEQALNRLDDFIQDILNYSRNTRLEVVTERIDFTLMLEEVCSLYLHLSNFGEVEMKISIHEEATYYGDKKRLSIIFNNLISNAYRYYDPHKDHSYISVEINSHTHQAEIIVRDNGLGIDEKHHEKIFDMFYRASNTSKGSGLGLFIVKESVAKMGGEIILNSTHGEGTRFIITLPNQTKTEDPKA